MKRILTVFFLSSLIACSQPKTFERSNDIEKDLKALLPVGFMSFDVMDQVYQSERQIELTNKFQESIRDNYEWFIEYSQQAVEPGKPMPYHENLGLTKAEYEELQGFMENIELASSRVVEYTIAHIDQKIVLEPVDTVNNLKVVLDFAANQSFFDGQTLTFGDTIIVNDPQNGFKSEWSGYQWTFEQPSDMDMNALKDLQNLQLKQYKLTVGFLERTGKTYLQIKGREISMGIKTKDYAFPLVEH